VNSYVKCIQTDI